LSRDDFDDTKLRVLKAGNKISTGKGFRNIQIEINYTFAWKIACGQFRHSSHCSIEFSLCLNTCQYLLQNIFNFI